MYNIITTAFCDSIVRCPRVMMILSSEVIFLHFVIYNLVLKSIVLKHFFSQIGLLDDMQETTLFQQKPKEDFPTEDPDLKEQETSFSNGQLKNRKAANGSVNTSSTGVRNTSYKDDFLEEEENSWISQCELGLIFFLIELSILIKKIDL